MSNIDPQIAAEFAALERLRLAVLQYREEVGSLRRARGVDGSASVPLVDLEDLPAEFALLAKTVKESVEASPDPTPKPVVVAPVPPVAPVVPAPVAPPPVVAPPVVPVVPVTPPPVVNPPPVIAAPVAAPLATKAVVIAPDEPDEFTGETQDIRVKTSPFAPITPAKPMPQVRIEPGLAAKAEPLVRLPDAPAELKTPVPLSAESQATPRINIPAATPSAMMRRPGMSPSMQIETLGSFLRRFRLAGD